MEKVEVVVVGGGPAGLAAACVLAEAGAEVLVVERGDGQEVDHFGGDSVPLFELGGGFAAPRLRALPGGQVEHRERGVGPLDRVEREGEVERGLGADGERLRRLVLRQDDAGEEPVVGRGQPLPDLRHRHPPRRAGPAAGGEQGEDQDQEQGFTVRG